MARLWREGGRGWADGRAVGCFNGGNSFSKFSRPAKRFSVCRHILLLSSSSSSSFSSSSSSWRCSSSITSPSLPSSSFSSIFSVSFFVCAHFLRFIAGLAVFSRILGRIPFDPAHSSIPTKRSWPPSDARDAPKIPRHLHDRIIKLNRRPYESNDID